jgi:AbrB family looped-hinge helix DNA binding protein
MRRLVKKLRRGQITIPKEFRDAMGLGADDRLSVTLEDGKLVIEPVHLTMTMGSPWLKGLYDHMVPAGDAMKDAPQQEIAPVVDAASKKGRPRRSRK